MNKLKILNFCINLVCTYHIRFITYIVMIELERMIKQKLVRKDKAQKY